MTAFLTFGLSACVQMQGVDHHEKGAGASNITNIQVAGTQSGRGGSSTAGDDEQTPAQAGSWNVGPGEWGAGGQSSSHRTPKGAGGAVQHADDEPLRGAGGTEVADIPEEGCTPDKVFKLPQAGGAQPTVDPVGQEALCIAVSGPIAGWECHGLDGRGVTVNSQPTQCGAMLTLPGPLNDGFRYFKIAAIPASTTPVYYTGGIGWW